jgi:hypothetical protein
MSPMNSVTATVPEMRDGADFVGEHDHGVLARLRLKYVPDELGYSHCT